MDSHCTVDLRLCFCTSQKKRFSLEADQKHWEKSNYVAKYWHQVWGKPTFTKLHLEQDTLTLLFPDILS